MILKTENGPLYFETTGQGPPLVFVSGWAMSCECWRPAVELLSQKYRCLIYDTRGVGRSQPYTIDAQFAVEDHATDLHRLLEAASIFDATIIAHDLGSLVAAMSADRHPQDLCSLVMVSPRVSFEEAEIKRLSVYTPASLALRELASFPLLRTLVAWRFRRVPQPFRDILYNDFAYISPRAAYELAWSATNLESNTELEKLIARGVAPTFVVCGEKDKKGVAQARKLFSRMKQGRLATMRDCGFLPMLEYPLQFARLVDDFAGAMGGLNHRRLFQK